MPVIREADRSSLYGTARAGRIAGSVCAKGHANARRHDGRHLHYLEPRGVRVAEFRAIVNPGESAIIALSSIVPTPIAVGDGIGIRQVMKLTLAAHHRLVDGELAARFLNALRRGLQDSGALRGDILNG